MSYIKILIQDDQKPMIIYIIDNPTILFEMPIKFIRNIEINNEKYDTNYYIVTLYTNNFSINLDKNTYIYYHENKNDGIESYRLHSIMYMNNNEFTKGTVQFKQENDTVNKIIHNSLDDSLNYPYDNEQYDCAEHSDLLKKCK